METPLRAGADREKGVLYILAALDDSYHIFCDLYIRLLYTVRYKGQKNLRSAQMDIVVACLKDVFFIETKNWSGRYAMNLVWWFGICSSQSWAIRLITLTLFIPNKSLGENLNCNIWAVFSPPSPPFLWIVSLPSFRFPFFVIEQSPAQNRIT